MQEYIVSFLIEQHLLKILTISQCIYLIHLHNVNIFLYLALILLLNQFI